MSEHEHPTNGKPPARPVQVVVTLPVKREVPPGKHLDNLRASGLSDDTIKLAQLYVELLPARVKLLIQRHYKWISGHALVFPFFLPGASEHEPFAYRIRPEVARRDPKTGKPVKYDQASSYGALHYFAPRARAGGWYADAARVLYWSEGEKKALALDQLELACVGLTGVWLWGDRDGKSEHGERLHPRLAQHVHVAGREHVIVFDADARTNNHVMLAAQKLAGVLLAAGAASVKFVCPPDVPENPVKGIDDYLFTHGEAAVRALLATAAPLEPTDPTQPLARCRALAALRDAPLPESLLMPREYDVEKDGSLWRAAIDDKHGAAHVTHAPMFITRRLSDLYTREERADVTYARAGHWPRVCVSRKAIADSRTMVAELTGSGAPVTSSNSAKIVDWLHAFEAANIERLEHVTTVALTGWHAIESTKVFTTHQTHAPESTPVQLILDTHVHAKLFAALKPRGTLDAHLRALRAAWAADPVCAAMVCASFATALLEPLGASNFGVHLSGDSSLGKTSKLKIGASVWGNPSEPLWVASWSTTPTAAELRAAVLNDLPNCYDEIGAADAEAVERLVYTLINGTGRGRASRDVTMRDALSWRTIILSTGERELTDESTATGAQVRIVQFPVSGFGALTAAEIDALRDECAANSGSAGEAWVQALVAVEDWAPYTKAFANAVRALRASAKGNPLQGRTAQHFALLVTCESMLHEAFELGAADGCTMRKLFESVATRERVKSLDEKSIEACDDWLLSEADAFSDLNINSAGDAEPRKGHGTRYGFRKLDGTVLIIPEQFKSWCKRSGFPAREVLRGWLRRGWAIADSGHQTKLHRLGGSYQAGRFVTLTPREDRS